MYTCTVHYAMLQINIFYKLEYLIQHRRMQEKEAKKKFCQIVLAVDYCHQQGIVHRDLKVPHVHLQYTCNVVHLKTFDSINIDVLST